MFLVKEIEGGFFDDDQKLCQFSRLDLEQMNSGHWSVTKHIGLLPWQCRCVKSLDESWKTVFE